MGQRSADSWKKPRVVGNVRVIRSIVTLALQGSGVQFSTVLVGLRLLQNPEATWTV